MESGRENISMKEELEKLAAAGKLTRQHVEALVALTESGYCFHRSWGFGKIISMDPVFARCVIDFQTKAGHTMDLTFAAESLKPISSDHIYARKVSDLDGLRQMAAQIKGKYFTGPYAHLRSRIIAIAARHHARWRAYTTVTGRHVGQCNADELAFLPRNSGLLALRCGLSAGPAPCCRHGGRASRRRRCVHAGYRHDQI